MADLVAQGDSQFLKNSEKEKRLKMAGRKIKKIDGQKFIEAYNRHFSGELTREEAAKLAGLSVPTFNKHLNTLIMNGILKDVFTDPKFEVVVNFEKRG